MKKVIVRGPALSQSGYGEHTRFLLRALNTCPDEFDVYLINTPWGASSWKFEDNEERAWIDSLLMKTINAGATLQADFSLQVTVPNEWVRICEKNIGLTAGIETDRISDSWVRGTHFMDKIIVPSEHAKAGITSGGTNVKDPLTGEEKTLGVTTPVDVVSFPYRNTKPEAMLRLQQEVTTSFNFLSVAQISPRKNIESTLIGFLEEFHNEEDVGLILKVNLKNNSLTDQSNTKTALKSLIDNFPDRKCKVYLVHGNLTDGEMAGLYDSSIVNSYVSTSHGEGFGLPIFEAAASGVPLVAPNWGGYVDYTNFKPTTKSKQQKPHFLTVDYEVKPVQEEAVWTGVIERGTKWCHVDLPDLKVKMRDMYSNFDKHVKVANKLKKHITNTYSEDLQNSLLINSIKEIL